ncbi:hypothetical protein Tco_0976071 [Tanacetum coccineum]|uniref:RNA-directed DNA polymerase, eukaryota n=1 Tax=Tanacetum coccineum TaxID=301880 RepID=A0ABQ5EG73_9ASTR
MNKAGTKLSKLDRFLISEDVTIWLPDVRITAIDRLWSDHNPILLHIDKTDFGLTPFKLYNSWLLRDGFDNLIKEEWELLDSNLKCHEKFRRLKDKIKTMSNNIKSWKETGKNREIGSRKPLFDQDAFRQFLKEIPSSRFTGDIPFNYLGLPVGSNMKSIASWKTLVDRFHRKANLLSIGGRLTLIKFVLGSLGIYYLSIFRAPESVLQDLDKKSGHKAYHGWTRMRFRYHLVVCFKGIWATLLEPPIFLPRNGIILSNTFRFKQVVALHIRFGKIFGWRGLLCLQGLPICGSSFLDGVIFLFFKLLLGDSFNDWIISWHASKEKKHRFYVITTSVLWWALEIRICGKF